MAFAEKVVSATTHNMLIDDPVANKFMEPPSVDTRALEYMV